MVRKKALRNNRNGKYLLLLKTTNLKNYFAKWQKTTSDPYIFNIKRGYQIDFYTFSSQSNPPNPIKFSDDEKRAGFLQ